MKYTIQEIKREAKYYLGRSISDQEAEEILNAYNSHNGSVSLDEILMDYYY